MNLYVHGILLALAAAAAQAACQDERPAAAGLAAAGVVPEAVMGNRLIQTEAKLSKTAPGAAPAKELSRQKAPRLKKMGLVCSHGYAFADGPGCDVEHLQAFTDPKQLRNSDGATFFYNYQLTAPPSVQAWMNERSVEFVPMVGWRHLSLTGAAAAARPFCAGLAAGRECRCYFTDPALAPATAPGREGPACQAEDLARVLQESAAGLRGRARPRHLLGFHEPEDASAKHKQLSPREAVEYWRKFIQPAAQEANLSLVSPTVDDTHCRQHSYGCSSKGTWYANFLKACWDRREAADGPCDVDRIAAVAVHLYSCAEGAWDSQYRPGTGRFFRDVKRQLSDHGGKDWDSFVDSRKIWATELNCNHDTVGQELPDLFVEATPLEACRRITGQAEPWIANNRTRSWGRGAVHVLEELPNVERYAWARVWGKHGGAGQRLSQAQLVADDGSLHPHGRALLRGLDPAACAELAEGDDLL